MTKYKIRFYREYEIETMAPEYALKEGRVLFEKDIALGKEFLEHAFIYEIEFEVPSGPGYKNGKRTFNGKILK